MARIFTPRRTQTLLGMLAAFGLAAAAWTAALALLGVYPFGDKSILITDLSQQYVEFHAALYDAVKQGDSLLFTWNTGMGMNFLGLFTYYLSSPFTLLLFLFPRALLAEAVLVIISAKIAAAAAAFFLYLRRRTGAGVPAALIFSVLYALSGYCVTYCFNLMWLDGVVLLPLVVLAARRVFDTRRFGWFTLALTVLFLANFYIAYVVGIFTFLLFAGWLFTRPEEKNLIGRRLGAFFGGTALAAGMAAFLLLPTLFSLTNGYESVHGLRLTFTAACNPLALPGKLAFGAFDSATNSGTPNLYTGLLTLGLAPLWFFHRDISRREKAVMGATGLFLLASLLLTDLDLAWHVFQPPTWFPFRYSFVVSFLLAAGAARVFSRPSGIRPRAVLLSFGSCALVMVLFGATGKLPFAGDWAVTAALLLAYGLLLFLFVLPRMAGRRVRGVLLAVLVAGIPAEAAFSAGRTLDGLDRQLHFVDHADYTAFVDRCRELTALLPEEDPMDFYRVENSTARNANDGISAGYHAVSHYSSLSNQRTFGLMGKLGMISYVSNRFFRYMGATSALDAVMGVRYVFDTEERRPGMVSTGRSYGDTVLFENVNALPLAYFADEAVLSFDGEEGDPFTRQNRLFSSLGGEEAAYYTPLPVSVSCFGGTLDETGSTIQVMGGTQLVFTIDNPERQHVLLYFDNNLSETSPVYLGDEKLNVYDDRLIRGVIDLGEQEAGEVTVRVPVLYDGWIANVRAAAFDEEAFARLVGVLRQNAPSSLRVTDTEVTGTLTAPRDGVIFTSIPCDGGWSAWIDGEKVETTDVDGAFLALEVTEGTHTFTLRFRPRGLIPGAVVSLLSAGAFAVLLLLGRRKRKRQAPPV